MITPQTQIKINLPLALKEYIASRAGRFGLPLAGYIKYLILKDVEGMDDPFYRVSARTEKKTREALRRLDKSVAVDDVETYFKKL